MSTSGPSDAEGPAEPVRVLRGYALHMSWLDEAQDAAPEELTIDLGPEYGDYRASFAELAAYTSERPIQDACYHRAAGYVNGNWYIIDTLTSPTIEQLFGEPLQSARVTRPVRGEAGRGSHGGRSRVHRSHEDPLADPEW
jgi:hypothetical protein